MSTNPRGAIELIEPAELLQRNREWAIGKVAEQPDFFADLSAQQSPEFLWIGCSDSRVPANQIVGLAPGEVFVHRNIANVVVQSDMNCLSVIQFAVEVLGVRHILVVGHHGCGGVAAALGTKRFGLIDNWLRPIQEVARRYQAVLDAAGGEVATLECLAELNVLAQTANVCRTTIVQDAWARGQELSVHGWIYSLGDGILRDLGMSPAAAGLVDEAFEAALKRVAAGYSPSRNHARRGILQP